MFLRSKIVGLTLVAASATLGLGLLGCSSDTTTKNGASNSDLTVENDSKKQSLTGSFVRHSAIGGESTGYALETADGELIELDLATNDLEDLFEESATVRVDGHYAKISGVEIPARTVFVVEAVEKTDGDGPSQEVQKLDGTLRQVAAIGGESTGYALELEDGEKLVELDLSTHSFESSFADGVKAYVEGTFKTVKGVEIPSRSVLVVTVLETYSSAL